MSLRDRAILTAAEEYASAIVRLKPWLGNPESPEYVKLFDDVMQKRDRLVMLAARRAIPNEGLTAQSEQSRIQDMDSAGMRDSVHGSQSSAGE